MNVIYSATNIILFLGAVQGIILGLVLLTKSKRNRMANRILALILFFFSGSISLHALAHSLSIPVLTDYHPLIIGIGLINFGPLFFLYIQSLTKPDFTFNRYQLIHFIPFGLILFAVVMVSLIFPGSEYENRFQEAIFLGVFVLSPAYIAASIPLFSRFSRRIKQNYSSIEKMDLSWIRFLLFCFVSILVMIVLIHLFTEDEHIGDYVWILTSIVIYLMGYFGLVQPEIFSGNLNQFGQETSISQKKYQKSTLTDSMAESCYRKLKAVMASKQLFLNSDLTLPVLAEELNFSTHHLSQVINERTGQSFYDYINSRRIATAKEQLLNPKNDHLGIAAIGFDVGFNSLSVFNKAFKKHARMTPSQYRNKA
ncbi:MAG: AraC family transcriptional regulator [Deltaproteobacteria bacterium]|jgi:AraC-like DNA-binding protein|nr:AraC family transcriptional regulator [Deltaproteobacteria bacterium]MBT4641084.1 AraC family transcriptional regulator [Deltaproteobacteria bacterium]MBT6499717.1 AraC family transcriptional regulator [Deltaproteobacteria bacterium]MBT6615555.1 AraC family transcriptional regulator [Deltaproteobacteria bacterium]MBT7154468.1 AraC family transcriptional regulator [Deltaproteobacteria bacterium]